MTTRKTANRLENITAEINTIMSINSILQAHPFSSLPIFRHFFDKINRDILVLRSAQIPCSLTYIKEYINLVFSIVWYIRYTFMYSLVYSVHLYIVWCIQYTFISSRTDFRRKFHQYGRPRPPFP